MKDNFHTSKRIDVLIVTIIFIVGAFFYYAIPGNFDEISSDLAYYAIAGKDIMSGNFLLDGWYGATNTFYFLALIYGIFGRILGYNIHLIYLIPALEWGIFIAAVTGIILKYNKQLGLKKYFSILVVLAMCLSCCYVYQDYKTFGGVHLDVLLLSLPFILCLTDSMEKENIKWGWRIIAAIIGMLLAIFSDALSLYFIIFPLLLFYIFKLCWRGTQNKKAIAFNLGLTVGVVVLEKCLQMIAQRIGAIQLAWSADSITFVSKEEFFDRIAYFIEEILYIFNADIFSKDISIDNIFCFINLLLLLITIGGIVADFQELMKKNLNQLLLIIIVVQSGIFLFTNYLVLSEGAEYSTRVMYFLFASYLILVGQVDWEKLIKKLNISIPQKWIAISTIAFVIVTIGLNIANMNVNKENEEKKDDSWGRVVEVLESNNLKQGYGTFWLANITTLASGCNIYVNPVGNWIDLTKFKWLSFDTSRWDYANFVLLDNSSWDNITRDTIVDAIGEPNREIIVDGTEVRVMIYDKNIMPYINDSGAENQVDAWWDIVDADNGIKEIKVNDRHFSSWFEADESGKFTSTDEGMLIYGPWKKMGVGVYDITFYYSLEGETNSDNSVLGWADSFSVSGGIENKKEDLISGTGSVTLKNVKVRKECDDVELRMYTTVAGLTVDRIEIKRQ